MAHVGEVVVVVTIGTDGVGVCAAVPQERGVAMLVWGALVLLLAIRGRTDSSPCPITRLVVVAVVGWYLLILALPIVGVVGLGVLIAILVAILHVVAALETAAAGAEDAVDISRMSFPQMSMCS